MTDRCKQVHLGQLLSPVSMVNSSVGQFLDTQLKMQRKKVQVTVDEGGLGKLRIYFNGSSLEKVFPLSSKLIVHFVCVHSTL